VAVAPSPVNRPRPAVSPRRPPDRDGITAIVPCCDAPQIESVLRQLRDEVGSVLVVADGVSPEEQRRIDGLAAALGVDVLRVERSRGKGHAVAAGFEHLARAGELRDAVLVLDADGQHPPQRVGDFAWALADADVAAGDRSADRARMPAVRRLGNAATNALLSLVLRRRVPDSQCGMRLFRTEALVRVPLPSGGFETETRHLKELVTAGLRVAWVPIPAIYGGETSAFRPWRDSWSVLLAALAPVGARGRGRLHARVASQTASLTPRRAAGDERAQEDAATSRTPMSGRPLVVHGVRSGHVQRKRAIGHQRDREAAPGAADPRARDPQPEPH
jgi:hypothetical protein